MSFFCSWVKVVVLSFFFPTGGHAAMHNGVTGLLSSTHTGLHPPWRRGVRVFVCLAKSEYCTYHTLDLHRFSKSHDLNVSPSCLRQSTNTVTSRHSGYVTEEAFLEYLKLDVLRNLHNSLLGYPGTTNSITTANYDTSTHFCHHHHLVVQALSAIQSSNPSLPRTGQPR